MAVHINSINLLWSGLHLKLQMRLLGFLTYRHWTTIETPRHHLSCCMNWSSSSSHIESCSKASTGPFHNPCHQLAPTATVVVYTLMWPILTNVEPNPESSCISLWSKAGRYRHAAPRAHSFRAGGLQTSGQCSQPQVRQLHTQSEM